MHMDVPERLQSFGNYRELHPLRLADRGKAVQTTPAITTNLNRRLLFTTSTASISFASLSMHLIDNTVSLALFSNHHHWCVSIASRCTKTFTWEAYAPFQRIRRRRWSSGQEGNSLWWMIIHFRISARFFLANFHSALPAGTSSCVLELNLPWSRDSQFNSYFSSTTCSSLLVLPDQYETIEL